jgi:hypothetical protein
MNDEYNIWESYSNNVLKHKNIDIAYTEAYKKGDEEKAQMLVDQAAKSAGYDLSHRQGSPILSDRHIMLFALRNDGNPSNPWRNDNYGKYNFLLKSSDLPEIPDWVKQWALDHPVHGKWLNEDNIEASINPEDIVDSAGLWDEAEFVSHLWNENENKFLDEEIYGFKTPDGAVVFDASDAPVKRGDAFLYDNKENLIPLSKRFV